MIFFYYLFLSVIFYQPLYSFSYADSLDHIINKKIEVIADTCPDVENIVKKIKSNIKEQVSLQEIDEFLDHEHSIAFFFCDEAQLRFDGPFSHEVFQVQEALKDLKFLLGAKLYLYYLECSKEKMLYKAVKNYDALNYWQNEKFYENQYFYQKNIFRWISRSSYQERIDKSIIELQELTQQTNSFLGLVKHNQDLLQQATNRQEFEQSLMIAVKLQEDVLHLENCDYENGDIGCIVKKSIEQVYRFCLNLSAQFAYCQLPSHIERHWQGYTLTAAGLCAFAFVYSRYGDMIAKSAEHFYTDHIEGPLQRNKEYFSGVAKAPRLPTEMHEENIIALIEAGAKKPLARGDETSLHEALARDCDIVSNGEFSAKFQQIDEKMAIIDEFIDKIKPGVDEFYVHFQRWNKFKQENPNALYSDLFGYWTDPVYPEKYEQGSRDGIYAFVGSPKSSKGQQEIHEGAVQVDADHQENLQEAFHNSSGEFGRAVQNAPCRVIEQPVDTSSWTFEQKKQHFEAQNKIIMLNPYKNMLRAQEPYVYKVEVESLQAKEVSNKVLNDSHMALGLTALIPVVTVIGGSLFASKNIYNSVAYQPIRIFMRKLEIHLNESIYQPVSFDREGHLYFLTEQLKLIIGVLTLQEQKMMNADITELQSRRLDYVQKFNVVQRMYRTYPCLIAATSLV